MFETITNRLVTKAIIKEEDKAIYQYGLEQGALILLFILTTMILGLLFHLFWESLIFFATYSVLRMQAGGYHAKTPVRCYVISVFITIGVLAAIAFIPFNQWIVLGVSIIASVVILFLAPVETENKPLDEQEIVVYKRRTRIILAIEFCMLVVTVFVGADHLAMCIALAILLVAIMVVAGKKAIS